MQSSYLTRSANIIVFYSNYLFDFGTFSIGSILDRKILLVRRPYDKHNQYTEQFGTGSRVSNLVKYVANICNINWKRYLICTQINVDCWYYWIKWYCCKFSVFNHSIFESTDYCRTIDKYISRNLYIYIYIYGVTAALLFEI